MTTNRFIVNTKTPICIIRHWTWSVNRYSVLVSRALFVKYFMQFQYGMQGNTHQGWMRIRISANNPTKRNDSSKRQTQLKIKNKIRPKLLNFEFCLMIYSNDVFFALADRNSSIFSWKSGLRGTSLVNDLVSLSFCSNASCTWLANTGIVLNLVLWTLSSLGLGSPATGGLCVSFELNIFILSINDIFAGSSSSNLAATVSVCVFTLYCATFTIDPGTYT